MSVSRPDLADPARLSRLSAPEQRVVGWILGMYAEGWFPMAPDASSDVDWVQPHERALVPLEVGSLHVPRSLRQRARRRTFEIRANTAFDRVLAACAESRPGDDPGGTWINPQILAWYPLLHRAGAAHSVEAWIGDRLVGGLYGVSIGSTFCGESMFSRPAVGGSDASKVCLLHLVAHLRRRGYEMLDSQIPNPHMAQFGVVNMPAAAYVRAMRAGLGPPRFEPFNAAIDDMPELWTRRAKNLP
jgi:leucyl/phenylalanyl-tRNA--protein transferase